MARICVLRTNHKLTFMSISIIYMNIILSSLLNTPTHAVKTSETLELEEKIQTLADSLPGCYTNDLKYYAKVKGRSPPVKRHILLKAEFFKLKTPIFNDSLTIYFQHFSTPSSSRLSTSGFYSFTLDSRMQVIRMRIFKVPVAHSLKITPTSLDPMGYTIASDYYAMEILQKRSQNRFVLERYKTCDMYWTQMSDGRFVGMTIYQCPATLGRDWVHFIMSMTVSNSKIALKEGWYNVDNGTDFMVLYHLNKKLQPSVIRPSKFNTTTTTNNNNNNNNREAAVNSDEEGQSLFNVEDYKENNIGTKDRLNKKSRLSIPAKNVHDYKNVKSKLPRVFIRVTVKNRNRRTPINSRKQPWTRAIKHRKGNSNSRLLRRTPRSFTSSVATKTCQGRQSKGNNSLLNFRHVISALTSGDEVNFYANLTGCSIRVGEDLDRRSFGGKISDFIYVKDKGLKKLKERLYFSTAKTAMAYQGVEHTTREMTLIRGGRIEVKVTTGFSRSSSKPITLTWKCRLYNRKGQGSVHLFSKPTSDIRKVKDFDTMTSLLGQGHDLRLVADFARCQGSSSNPEVVVGSSITDYDVLPNQELVEMFLPVDKAVPTNFRNGRRNGYNGLIAKSGDAFFTWVSGRAEGGIETELRMSNAYHCNIMANHTHSEKEPGLTKRESEYSSLGVFYRI